MQEEIKNEKVLLTQYSRGAGCGCKIAPNVLEEILKSNLAFFDKEKDIEVEKLKIPRDDKEQLKKIATPLVKSGYGTYLLNLIKD
jgi:selenophosphate synthase